MLGPNVAEAQRHAHQQRRQRAAGQALQCAQQQERRQVRRQRAQHPQHHEGGDHHQAEAAQREGGCAPGREGHRADRHGAVDAGDPVAVIGTEPHPTADVGQRDLGDVLVEARQQHHQQHAAQSDHDAAIERGGKRGGRGLWHGDRAHGRGPIRAAHGR
ncbi:hypothetical protein G6F62_013824 [Rhizopus arrhizus]|nr:hypothetical protein G6F62_013824 [Rhizopus arrhizus]